METYWRGAVHVVNMISLIKMGIIGGKRGKTVRLSDFELLLCGDHEKFN